MRTAFPNMASNTDSRSPGDELMTRKISAVAVCCSSASFSSRVSRAIFVSCPAAEERRTAHGLWRIAALYRYRLATSRFQWFTA
jgi:hypothetical protein